MVQRPRASLPVWVWVWARVSASPIDKLIITDSIPATEAVRISHNIEQLSIAPLMAEAMKRISDEASVSSLFD